MRKLRLICDKLIKDFIIDCYSQCSRTQELHNDFSGYNIEECAEDIIKKIKDFENYKFYNIDNKAYYGVTKIGDINYLHTFFVKPEHRNRDFIGKFWDNIKNELDCNFLAGVYKSNKPARNFLKNNLGLEIIDNNIAFYVFQER